MIYLKAYFEALIKFGAVMGGIYLVLSTFLFPNATSYYFLYLTVFGALAAPVGMLIGGKPQ
jgi:hypothetical protein